MKLNVILKSGINGEGFDTVITNGNEHVHEKSWRYGYDCSYDKAFASESKPYVADVLQGLIDKHHVDELSIEAGTNIFAGKDVAADRIEEFRNNYCQALCLDSDSLSASDEMNKGITGKELDMVIQMYGVNNPRYQAACISYMHNVDIEKAYGMRDELSASDIAGICLDAVSKLENERSFNAQDDNFAAAVASISADSDDLAQ